MARATTAPLARGRGRVTPRTRFRAVMVAGLGCGIPLMSLALSHVGGKLLLADHWCLASMSFGLMGSVLGVSLPHLAWGVGDLTRSPRRACWLLAIALDLSLVLGELVQVYASDVGLTWLTTTVMVAVALVSMCLNVHAFRRHQ